MPAAPTCLHRRPPLAVVAAAALAWSALAGHAGAEPRLDGLARSALELEAATRGPAGREAAVAWRDLERRLDEIDPGRLEPHDRVDHGLLEAHIRTRLFELERLELHRLIPSSYIELAATSELYLRPCVHADELILAAAEEIEALPPLLARAESDLGRPAAVWTRQAIAVADYASTLLREHVPRACVDDPALERRLLAAAPRAAVAVERYRAWLERELLPRSTREPAWKPAAIEHYLAVHEGLAEVDPPALLELAERAGEALQLEMAELARRIHPSGEPRRVWALMQEEAPPWAGVQPMAEGYGERLQTWLRAEGAALLPSPGDPEGPFDVTFLWIPRAPATGPPLPPELRPEEEREAWRRSLAPYWTHLLVVQRRLGEELPALDERGSDSEPGVRPSRRLYRSRAWEEGWPLYVAELLEEEGYFDGLPYLERLKTRMARRQLRMWQVERTLAALRMARGEIDLDRAAELCAERAGVPPARARAELVLDSQSPRPPLALIGARLLVDLREEFLERSGEPAGAGELHRRLLELAGLPLPAVRELLLGDAPAARQR